MRKKTPRRGRNKRTRVGTEERGHSRVGRCAEESSLARYSSAPKKKAERKETQIDSSQLLSSSFPCAPRFHRDVADCSPLNPFCWRSPSRLQRANTKDTARVDACCLRECGESEKGKKNASQSLFGRTAMRFTAPARVIHDLGTRRTKAVIAGTSIIRPGLVRRVGGSAYGRTNLSKAAPYGPKMTSLDSSPTRAPDYSKT